MSEERDKIPQKGFTSKNKKKATNSVYSKSQLFTTNKQTFSVHEKS
jgi:hypothetical protein